VRAAGTRPSAPSGKVRLARGLSAPSGEVRLTRGLSVPSGKVRLARGLSVPSAKVRLTRGSPHTRHPAPARTSEPFNDLTPAGLRYDPDAPGNHALALFRQLPGQDHPRHCTSLCEEVGVSSVALCRLLLYG
jgi:hypothetical protein